MSHFIDGALSGANHLLRSTVRHGGVCHHDLPIYTVLIWKLLQRAGRELRTIIRYNEAGPSTRVIEMLHDESGDFRRGGRRG